MLIMPDVSVEFRTDIDDTDAPSGVEILATGLPLLTIIKSF